MRKSVLVCAGEFLCQSVTRKPIFVRVRFFECGNLSSIVLVRFSSKGEIYPRMGGGAFVRSAFINKKTYFQEIDAKHNKEQF